MSIATPTNESIPAVRSMAFDVDGLKQEIAKNWGWIMAAGVIAVAGGTAALLAPVLATGIAVTIIAATLFVLGCVNLAGVFFAETGLKLESFLTGVIQVLLATVMAFYPFASLLSMTVLIAAFIMADGIMRIALAVQNRDLPGRGWALASGLAGIAVSVLVLTALPTSSLWVIGVLVGVSLICNGAARIAVAIEARKIAHAAQSA